MQTALLITACIVVPVGIFSLFYWIRPMPRVQYYQGTFARTSKTRTSHLNDDGTYS